MAFRWPVLLAALAFAGCPASGGGGDARPKPKGVQSDVTAEDYLAPPMPIAKLTLRDAFGGAHRVEVEVAATPALRQRGMMWRKSLAEGKGMLFIFPTEEPLSFWMKNTLIPLDMIFIGRDKTIRGIVANATPRSLTSVGVAKPSVYVLEVPGGWAEKIGVQPGSSVELEGSSMIEVVP